MKNHLILLLTILLLLPFGGCKKYEEGPCISFRSPERRIYGGWKVEEFNINGINKLSSLKKNYGDTVIISSNKMSSEDGNELVFFGILHLCMLSGDWIFSEDKTKFSILFYGVDCPHVTYSDTIFSDLGPINYNKSSEWNIHKLTNTIFIYETTYEDDNYYFKLKKL